MPVNRFHPRPLPPILWRLLALAVLLLGAVMQPVMASVGDIHALGHGAALHGQADAHEGGQADDDGHGDEGDGGSLLHALMHAGHCCGHATAMAAISLDWSLAMPSYGLPGHPGIADRSHRPGDRFRPPIVI